MRNNRILLLLHFTSIGDNYCHDIIWNYSKFVIIWESVVVHCSLRVYILLLSLNVLNVRYLQVMSLIIINMFRRIQFKQFLIRHKYMHYRSKQKCQVTKIETNKILYYYLINHKSHNVLLFFYALKPFVTMLTTC